MQFTGCHRTHCRVCGFSEVRTDEAVDREVVLLAECPRCDHRWTTPFGSVAAVEAAPARTHGEVASAA